MNTKTCRQCKENKDLKEFSFEKRNIDGRKGSCKLCHNKSNKESRERTGGEANKRWVKEHQSQWRAIQIKHRYGLTKEETDAKLKEQDWKCAVCKKEFTEEFHIDHDHTCCDNETGKTCGKCIRGFLCKNCNLGLGRLNDDVNILTNAITYLEKYSMKGINGGR